MSAELSTPVTLTISGATVSSYSEAWRAECEAKRCLAIATVAERRAHLDVIEQRRGKAAANALRADILLLHCARQSRHLGFDEVLRRALEMADTPLRQTVRERFDYLSRSH